MFATLKRWGNSLAIRVSREELERLGLGEGDEVRVTLQRSTPRGPIDLSGLPTVRDRDRRSSERHDALLYRDR